MPSILPFELPAIVLGLLLGSFLNVCIVRLPRGESVVKPRSHCPHCGHTIRTFDNIPVLSWLLLRGRCRDCGAPISWRYPAVELAIALWFGLLTARAATALTTGSASTPAVILDSLALAILGFLLIGLMVMDWQTHLLPDTFTLTGTGIGFFLTCCRALFLGPGEGDVHFDPRNQMRMSSPGSFAARGDVFLTGPEALVLGRVAAILAAACLLLVIRVLYRRLRHQDGMGLGDVKLLAMIAAFLGFFPALLSLFAGALLASLYAIPLLLRGRAGRTTALPFGTFLCAGGLLVALFGAWIIGWYRTLL